MLRCDRQTKPVESPCTTSGQEMELVYSYNPWARTGLLPLKMGRVWPPENTYPPQKCYHHKLVVLGQTVGA